MSNFEEKPFSESHLDSPEYRKRLTRKLNTLIAVLEVACAKVERSLHGQGVDVDRLNRIHRNLSDTLQVCMRARRALERSETLPGSLTEDLRLVVGRRAAEDAALVPLGPRGQEVELSSEEVQKFEQLGPIDPREVRGCDIDLLCEELLRTDG